MSEQAAAASTPAGALLALYDRDLGHVYGYLLARCGRVALAEDLTAETFLAAVDAVRRDPRLVVSRPWIIGVARHKLVDHWRRTAREERGLQAVGAGGEAAESPWDARLDVLQARETLEQLAPQHRAALTLRYLDDLPVPAVAAIMHRTEHATEALLVRSRIAFRRAYRTEVAGDG
jgi:RNA polymerase sigma-70 factor (ECF subfamily)